MATSSTLQDWKQCLRRMARAKSNFTRSRNKLLILFEQEDMPSRKDVRNACHSMDTCLEIVMGVLSNFSDFYTKNNELQTSRLVVKEMEINRRRFLYDVCGSKGIFGREKR